MGIAYKKIVYLLSDDVDSGNRFAEDSGPAYARNMGWETGKLSDLQNWAATHAVVVDELVSEREALWIETQIIQEQITITLKVVDPYAYHLHGRHGFYYRMLFRMVSYNHVSFLCPYTPVDLLSALKESVGNRFIHIPYPFVKEKCISFKRNKKNKIIYSGALGGVYSRRSMFFRASLPFRKFSVFVDTLLHPGYGWLGQRMSHSIVGEAYIEYLSRYQYMFLEPSNFNIEFLKYNECAYAGCIPVGAMPTAYQDIAGISSCFISLDFSSTKQLFKSIWKLYVSPPAEVGQYAIRFRELLSQHRDPALLTRRLQERLWALSAVPQPR